MGSIKKEKFDILVHPRITEKAAVSGSQGNCVVFEVHPDANKREIRAAVESIFDVKVARVRTLNNMGKEKRIGARALGRRKDSKKAYVFLKPGSTLDVVEGL